MFFNIDKTTEDLEEISYSRKPFLLSVFLIIITAKNCILHEYLYNLYILLDKD